MINVEKIKDGLRIALKVVKILAALIMFLLGLLGEGANLVPNMPETDVEEISQSLSSSVAGLGFAAVTGWPVLYWLGQSFSNLLVCA